MFNALNVINKNVIIDYIVMDDTKFPSFECHICETQHSQLMCPNCDVNICPDCMDYHEYAFNDFHAPSGTYLTNEKPYVCYLCNRKKKTRIVHFMAYQDINRLKQEKGNRKHNNLLAEKVGYFFYQYKEDIVQALRRHEVFVLEVDEIM
jgi:hypothetical protein